MSADPSATDLADGECARGPGRSVERGQIADDVAGSAHPEQDLAPSRCNARDDRPAALDQEHALGEIALREHCLASAELHTPALLAQRFSEQSAILRRRGHGHGVANARSLAGESSSPEREPQWTHLVEGASASRLCNSNGC
ncbi:MAG: hypothetical protein WCD11_25330 [Solirubrobacteraceae bacterium]